MVNQEESILTIDDVCEILKVGRSRVYKMLADGSLKAFRLGRTWKITREALQEFLETGGYSYEKLH